MNKRVVLIVGAGASKDLHNEFGLGSELIQQIESRVADNRDLVTFFTQQQNINFGILQTFKNNLAHYRQESKFKSIDEFLTEVSIFPEYRDWRDEYLKIGKTAILFHVVGWEEHFKNILEPEMIQHTWVGQIIKFLEDENILDHYKNAKVIHSYLRILTFNYDRTLEYCLLKYYEKYKPDYLDAVKSWIENYVIHIYDELDTAASQLGFGHPNNDLSTLIQYIDKIQVAYDSRGYKLKKTIRLTNSSATFFQEDYIQSEVSSTLILGSIGFGFDYFNCRNIGLTKRNNNILANIIVKDNENSFDNRRYMTNSIRSMFPSVDFKYMPCKDFLEHIFNIPGFV